MARSFFILILPLLLATTTVSKPCPPCGTTVVPYPLSTSSSCGDPLYTITCTSNNTLIFNSINSSYPITSITPSTQRLVIQPAPFTSPTSCSTTDLPHRGIQLNPSLPFNVTSSNTIMLLNCTARLLLSPLNCSSTSLCHTYVNATVNTVGCRNIPICCTFQAGGSGSSYAVAATGVGCSAYKSFVDLDTVGVPVGQWGRSAGVELQWASPLEPVCSKQTDCEGGGNATCRADTAAGGVGKRCYCNAPLKWNPFTGTCAVVNLCPAGEDCDKSSNNAALIAGLVSGITGALLVAAAAFFYLRRQQRIRQARDRLTREREEILNLNNSSGRSAKNFTGKEIKRATSNFSRHLLLGSGGFGDVYKGKLDDGTIVAVKCAKIGNTKSTDQVLNEVRILSQVNHRALVRLLGCCVDLDQPLMVYEFIPNGTLYDHIHGVGYSLLSWRHRLGVAHRTAEGLAYLHFSASPPIYHRDVKSSNILLDEKLNAKVADFGLSRLAEPDLSHVSTCAQGTLGYLDPEYYRNYQLTDKSDVYSFGVVLLELLTSQKAIDFSHREPDDVNLAVYVERMVAEERLMEVVDKELQKEARQVELDTMKALGFLAVSCLEERRQSRPSMKEVAEEIEYIMGILEADGAAKPVGV